jgi:hypothetical protein
VSLLAAPIKCKEGQGIAPKSQAAGRGILRRCSANNSIIGEASAIGEVSANENKSIRLRVDASCRLLYDELGKGA